MRRKLLYIMQKAIQTGLGLIFIFAGVSKLLDLESFAIIIESFEIIGETTSYYTAHVLSVIEVLTGIGLLIRVTPFIYITGGLLIIFSLVLSKGILMGLNIDCGCFGPFDPDFGSQGKLDHALYRNLIMIAGTGFLHIMHKERV